MGFFTRWILGPILRAVVGAVFIAACVAIGFGPDEWLQFVLEGLPSWVTPALARWAFVVLGIATILLLFKIPEKAARLWQSLPEPPLQKKLMGPIILFVFGVVCIIASAVWYLSASSQNQTAQPKGIASATVDPVSKPPTVIEDEPLEQEQQEQPVAGPDAPIEWYFNGAPEIFGWNITDDGTLLVGTFNVRGRNVSNEPIRDIVAYIRPKVTSEDIELRFSHPRDTDLLETAGYLIEPGAEFQLSYRLPSFDASRALQGVPVDVFLSKYGALRFVFRHDFGHEYAHEFTYDEIRDYLFSKLDEHAQKRTRQPDIRKE